MRRGKGPFDNDPEYNVNQEIV